MTENYRNAFTEVYEIIKYLNREEYNKIPDDIITVIKENRNKEYEYYLDESISVNEQTVLPETKAILFNLFRDYLSSEKQREKIVDFQRKQRYNLELTKKKKYDYNKDIFMQDNQNQIKVDKMQDKRIILPTDLKEKIEKNWENAIKSGANIWNGEVSLVSNIIEDANKIKIVCSKTDYAHYLYGERVGLPEEYSCPNLSGGAIIETSDNYYIIGELEKSTSYPRMLTLSGENIDVEDINCGCIDIIKTISRECTEEINIGLEDKSKVRSFKIKYICAGCTCRSQKTT